MGAAAVRRHLLSVTRQIHKRSEWVARPVWGLPIGATLIIAAVVAGTIATPLVLRPPDQALDLLEFVQILESAINDVILIGAALFFLVSLETRIKRGRALAALLASRCLNAAGASRACVMFSQFKRFGQTRAEPDLSKVISISLGWGGYIGSEGGRITLAVRPPQRFVSTAR